jgi:hypothetical protein
MGLKGYPLLVLKRKCREKGTPLQSRGARDIKKLGVIIYRNSFLESEQKMSYY